MDLHLWRPKPRATRRRPEGQAADAVRVLASGLRLEQRPVGAAGDGARGPVCRLPCDRDTDRRMQAPSAPPMASSTRAASASRSAVDVGRIMRNSSPPSPPGDVD